MDWMWQDYQAKVDKVPYSQLGDDYLFGFHTANDFQRRYVADSILHGCVPEDDMRTLTRLSLLRGSEEFDQMLSCANAMREKASFDNPLDGQDTLTFLSKILHPFGILDEASGDEAPTLYQNGKVSTKKSEECHGKSDLDQVAKKRGKDKQSPFWSTESSKEQVTQSANEMKRLQKLKKRREKRFLKKKMKREMKAQEAGGAHEDGVPSTKTLAMRPVLEANRRRRNEDLGSDGQESMSGPNILREIPSLCATTEAGESLKITQSPSTIPNDIGTVLDMTESSLDAPDKDDKLEGTGETLEKEKIYHLSQTESQTPKRKAKSPYFDTQDASPRKAKTPRPPRGTVPCIPFPRLDAPKFGLIQEDLAADPFRLLVVVTFLIRVKGKHAIPVFHELMRKYPTPRDVAEANTNDIIVMIKHLGLATTRAAAIQKYARIWVDNPPQAGVRYDVKNYSESGDGVDIQMGEILSSDGTGPSAWEIGHMTQGRYAIDSWRIFCRDVLLERAEDWRGKGREGEFQPEWMRVLPQDKELRACLRWLWMQEGWAWDPRTGDREILPGDLRKAVDEGRVAYDDAGELKILDNELLSLPCI
ncbi:DNA glycosylase [Annulohypoxylon bovei var. microspora]|nr:DNA glycosylase [Annulohypoxylon bovei var. microspora]